MQINSKNITANKKTIKKTYKKNSREQKNLTYKCNVAEEDDDNCQLEIEN